MKLLVIFTIFLVISTTQGSETVATSQGPLEGMNFVSIPAGIFNIGSDIVDSETFDETPQKLVGIGSFEIMSTEVTQGMWKELLGSTGSSIPFLWTYLCGRGSNYPVYAVSWYDCIAFIDSLNALDSIYIYRLPGEAEWEYACRAGSVTDFYWGDSHQVSSAGRFCCCKINESDPANSIGPGTQEVASLEPNTWGLFDMAGNVSEWCYDRYTSDYDYLPTDGSPFLYPCDEQWPYAMNLRRIHRGGSWLTSLNDCMSSSRSSQSSDQWATCIGFRLVRVPETSRNLATQFYHKGVESIDAGLDMEAIEFFGRALALNPTMIDALLYRGLFREGIGQTEQALADFDEALQLDQENAGTYQMMGVVLINAGYDQQALKALNRVVQLDPDYPLVYFHRGISHILLWNLDEAISDLNRAVVQDPASPSPYYARASAFFFNEQYDLAIEDLSSVIQRNPAYGEAYMFRSGIYRELGNLEQARADSISAAALGVDEW